MQPYCDTNSIESALELKHYLLTNSKRLRSSPLSSELSHDVNGFAVGKQTISMYSVLPRASLLIYL